MKNIIWAAWSESNMGVKRLETHGKTKPFYKCDRQSINAQRSAMVKLEKTNMARVALAGTLEITVLIEKIK